MNFFFENLKKFSNFMRFFASKFFLHFWKLCELDKVEEGVF